MKKFLILIFKLTNRIKYIESYSYMYGMPISYATIFLLTDN